MRDTDLDELGPPSVDREAPTEPETPKPLDRTHDPLPPNDYTNADVLAAFTAFKGEISTWLTSFREEMLTEVRGVKGNSNDRAGEIVAAVDRAVVVHQQHITMLASLADGCDKLGRGFMSVGENIRRVFDGHGSNGNGTAE